MAETALTYKEERFCQEYTVDYNQTAAATRAGYAEKSAAKTGCKLMKRPEIRAYIHQLQEEQKERLMLTSDRVLIELMNVYQKCVQAVPVETWSYELHEMVKTGEYQFDSKGATKALEMVGKHLGMFDRKEQTTDEGPVFISGEEELKE